MTKRVRIGLLAAAVLALGAVALPARAGVGPSQGCSDNVASGNEVHLIDSPITFNLEVGAGSRNYVVVCYSTTAAGDGSPALTGGWIYVDIDAGQVSCTPDVSVTIIAVSCFAGAGLGGVTVTLTPRVQSTSLPVGATSGSLSVGSLGGPVCLSGFTVFTPAGPIGPYKIGVCPP